MIIQLSILGIQAKMSPYNLATSDLSWPRVETNQAVLKRNLK